MSLAELQRLALINAELVQKGKPLQSYGLPSGQASEYAGLEGLFSSAQSAGSSSFFRNTIGGAVSGLTSLIKTGTEAGNYVGKQIGLPNLGSNLYTFLTPGSFLPDVLSRATTGKTLAEQLSSLGQNVAEDTSSTAYQVGNILGQAGTAILGTGAVSAGLKGLGIGAKAINAAGFTTTAADIGAGTAIGGALQAAGDWEQFDKSNGQPGAKMSGAEFLTRMGMGMITGGLSAPLNPRWGKLANIGFDAIVGGATQGALEGAGYLAANKARQEEIEKTYQSNIATSAAINAAIGAGARGVQALLAPKPAAAETVAPAAPATPVAALPAAQGVTPTAPTTINPLDQFKANISEWAKTTPPNEVNIIAQQLGAKDGSAQSLIERVDQIVEDMDPSGENIAGTLEWLDKQFGTQWHPKGTGQVLPVQPVAGAEQPQVSAEEAAERADIAEAGQQAPEQSAPANIQPSPGGYVYDLQGTARQVAQTMTLLERSNFADRVGLRSVAPEAIAQALNDPFVLTEHLLGKSPDLAKSLAQAMKLQDASPAAVVNAMRGGIDTSGKTPQEIYQRLGSMVERLVSTPPTPEPVPSPMQGEPNVQPRPEDVNVSEPGQPEPIAGEPPVQAVEPSEFQQAEAIPPTGAEGQAPEEVTIPITEPIAGEQNATQEGQVTEGGQPEYLGIPQGEDIQENVPEVRQEEGELPSDSSSPVEGGQEQAQYVSNNDPVVTVAGSELYNEFVGDIELDNPESLVDQYLRDGSITDFPNATSDQIARAEEIVETNLNGRKIQDLASMIIDQENTLSSESEKMASSIQKFLIGDTTGSHTLEMSVAGAQNPLRNLIGIIADYTGADAPDMRRMKKDAQATMLDDGVMRSDYVFEKDGVPVASMTYYKEPGNKRAIIILEPSKELQAAIRLQQSEVINRTMEDQYGVSSDIGEMFAEAETGISPAEVAQLDVQQTRDKRQLPYQENVESRSQMQQIYQEQIKEYANTYDVPVETFDAAVVAASNAEAESGRPGDIFQTDAWQSYVDGLQDPEQVAIAEDHNYRTDVREALAFKRQIEMATQTVAGPAKPRRTKRSKPEQKGFDFNEGAAKASLGILPAIAAPTLEDDKEYFPGVNGATLKGLLFAVGGGAFMVHHISKKPIMHVGAEITGLTTQRTTWMQSLRNRMVGVRDRIAGSDAKKLQHATIEHNARIYGEAMNLSEEQIKELAAKNIKDNDALESMPSMFGLGGVTSLSILGKQTGSALPGRLAEAAYAGRAIGEKRSIAINLAQKAFKSLPEDRQVALGQLLIDIDYATTNRINAEQIMSTENRWTPKAATLRDLCKQEIENVLKKTAAQNPSAWPQLEQDYRMLDPIYDDARRAYFEMVAFEQAGVESIDSGFKSYGKKIDQLEKVKAGALEQLQSAQAKGASLEEIKAITSAIEGINNQVIMAMKMRNVIGDLRNARDMSVVRKYIPRWFDVDRHEFRIRIKETATDIGLVQSFKDEAGMTRFLERMNKQLTDEDRKLNGIPATHPQTGRDINTFSDFYRSQGGSVEVVVNKQKITKIIEHTADQMALREALEALQDSVADGGGITADRFKRFFEAYGSDLSNMITAKELDDIGISGREIDKLVAANSRVSTAQIRRLINAVAVPRMTDVTMHRANVLGYAPERINNLTKEVNPLFSRDMVDFIDNGFNFFLARTKSRAESASLRREINSQIIDLTARGIAPTYVDRIASIGSGLRWKPTTMTTALGKEILLSRFDRKIAAFGAFKMMGGNVPSAVKNVFMGFINTATQLSSETDGSLAKAMSLGYKGEAAYWQMLAKDRSMRKEMAAHLRSPDSLQTIDEQINRAIKSNDAARAVWIMARESGAFDAVFYKNLERVLNPETISKSKIAQKIVDIAALPQVLAEHHNRGASFMTGAMAHLQQFPADVEGAFAKGLQFQGMTQGNFNNYNKSALERKLMELPFGRSFLLLSNAALRSNEQLGAHFVAAAMRPTHSKVWVPLLAYAGTSMVFTGLVGAPIAGDVYKTVNFIADLFEKDDDELKAIKESPLEALQRKAGESAAAMGFSQELGEWVFKNISIGTSSVLTGKNFSTENTIINFATQWPPPGISAPLAAFDYFRNFGDMQTPTAMVIGGTSAFNAELGRIFRGFEQVRVGGKLGKSGDQVSTGYDLKNYVGDVLFGSDLDDALYGTSKRGGGGKIYFADQANAYMKTIDNIGGIKLDQRLHKDPFFVKTEGLPDKQAMVEAVNKFRSLNIVNYDALAEQRQRTLDIWNGIASDPEKRKVLVRIAMEGQQGSRQSDPGAWIDGAGDKIKSYYLGLAVQRSYSQMGIPPPEFKYQEADPMFPVWKYIADKAKRGGIMIAPE